MPISDLLALEFIGHTCITLAHIHINKNKNLKKTSQDILLIVIVRAMCIIRNTDREKKQKEI